LNPSEYQLQWLETAHVWLYRLAAYATTHLIDDAAILSLIFV